MSKNIYNTDKLFHFVMKDSRHLRSPLGLLSYHFDSRTVMENQTRQEKRQLRYQDAQPSKLPLKTREGKVKRLKIETKRKEGKPSDSVLEITQSQQDPCSRNQSKSLLTSFEDVKARFSLIAESVLVSPETNVTLLKELFEYNAAQNDRVKLLACLTITEILIDIIPGYRIRTTDSEAKGIKLSKEIVRLRKFEKSLLELYKKHLSFLHKSSRSLKRSKAGEEDALGLFSFKCLVRLFQSAYHFNEAKRVLDSLIPFLCSSNTEVSKTCIVCFQEVLNSDQLGDVTFQMISMMEKLVNGGGSTAMMNSVRVLLHLPLLSNVTREDEGKNLAKKRKKDEIQKSLQRDLQKTEGELSGIRQRRAFSKILELTFSIFFKILKNMPSFNLLQITLKGIEKFAHLIDVDLLHDLILFLSLNGSEDPKMWREACLSSLAVLKLLQGRGQCLIVDLDSLCNRLYNVAILLPYVGFKPEEFSIYLRSVHFLFLERREKNKVRVAAFAKRLLEISVLVVSPFSNALLSLVQKMSQRYPTVQDLSQECMFSGSYDQGARNPDHSDVLSSLAWESIILKHHVSRTISKFEWSTH